MIIAFISDLHIRTRDDEACQKLIAFFKTPNVLRADQIYLLGDIFDLMAGFHKEYVEWYPEIFNEIEIQIRRGAKIVYVEGNHDLHLTRLFRHFLTTRKLPLESIQILKRPQIVEIDKKRVYISHGDEIEIDDPIYKYYKGFISLRIMEWVADHLMPLSLFEYLGRRASKKSKERRKNRYLESESASLKLRYRLGVEVLWKSVKFDTMICGHTHILDDFKSEAGFRYLNSGFPLQSNQFLFFESGEYSFKSIV